MPERSASSTEGCELQRSETACRHAFFGLGERGTGLLAEILERASLFLADGRQAVVNHGPSWRHGVDSGTGEAESALLHHRIFCVSDNAVNKLFARALELSGLGWFRLSMREKAAHRYLRGEGLEIGALTTPLRVFHRARVRYVDNTPRAENVAKFPELPPDSFVEPDYLCDGFTMSAVPAATQDFVIANHVLEHAPNPIAVLRAWMGALRPGGIAYVTVPIVDGCFDRGRPVTSAEHLIEDFELSAAGRDDAMRERNKRHYVEWLTISLPAINRQQNKPADPPAPKSLDREVDDWASRNAEIHFHTFTAASLRDFLEQVIARGLIEASIEDVIASKAEVIAILRSRAAAHAAS